jgi:predicted ATPase
MHPRTEVETAIGNLARNRVLEYLRAERRGGRSVVTLVDISEETALDPEAVESVMIQLEDMTDTPVRRASTDQLRWHIRR